MSEDGLQVLVDSDDVQRVRRREVNEEVIRVAGWFHHDELLEHHLPTHRHLTRVPLHAVELVERVRPDRRIWRAGNERVKHLDARVCVQLLMPCALNYGMYHLMVVGL